MNISDGRDRRALVVGLGNVLLADDGFGPLVIELFRSTYECSSDVDVLDLGTPGLDLGSYLYNRSLVVIVDTVTGEGNPGTLHTYGAAEFSSGELQLHLTSHDPGLRESLVQLELAGRAPTALIVIGAIPESCALGKSMSRVVANAASVAVNEIAKLLAAHGFQCFARQHFVHPKLWWATDSRFELKPETNPNSGPCHQE